MLSSSFLKLRCRCGWNGSDRRRKSVGALIRGRVAGAWAVHGLDNDVEVRARRVSFLGRSSVVEILAVDQIEARAMESEVKGRENLGVVSWSWGCSNVSMTGS
jgi:hypothetical protein